MCEEGGRLLCCSYCNVTAHRDCIKFWHWDLPDEKGPEALHEQWTCPDCVRDIDLQRHDGACPQCDEMGFIFQDIKRSIELLAHFSGEHYRFTSHTVMCILGDEHPVVEGDKMRLPAAEGFSVRVEEIERKLHAYVAHLVRTKAQNQFKPSVMQHLGLKDFYLLVDYWAKLKCRKHKEATCEGTQAGISCHGGMFIIRNPTLSERGELTEEFPEFFDAHEEYWESFPPPPDHDGPAFVIEHYDVLSNDSKQNNFHTRAVMQATLDEFHRLHPWITTDRSGFIQSDQAVNYRDPTTEIDLVSPRVPWQPPTY